MKINIGKYLKSGGRKIQVEVTDHDIWSLDYTLALVIAPALKKYRTSRNIGLWGNTLPVGFHELKGQRRTRAEAKAQKNIMAILDKMIRAFDLVIEDCATFDVKKKAAIREGLELFAKHFQDLWI